MLGVSVLLMPLPFHNTQNLIKLSNSACSMIVNERSFDRDFYDGSHFGYAKRLDHTCCLQPEPVYRRFFAPNNVQIHTRCVVHTCNGSRFF